MGSFSRGTGSVISLVVIAACSTSRNDSPEVAQEQEELGQSGCAFYSGYPYGSLPSDGGNPYTTNGATQLATPLSCGVYGYNRSDSPDTAYGDSVLCPGQYILEVRNLGFRANWVEPYWIDGSLNATSCGQSRIEVGVYKRSGSTGGWAISGTQKYHGIWDGYECAFDLDSGFSPLTVFTSGGDAIRLAGAAFTGSVKKRVSAFLGQLKLC